MNKNEKEMLDNQMNKSEKEMLDNQMKENIKLAIEEFFIIMGMLGMVIVFGMFVG